MDRSRRAGSFGCFGDLPVSTDVFNNNMEQSELEKGSTLATGEGMVVASTDQGVRATTTKTQQQQGQQEQAPYGWINCGVRTRAFFAAC